MGHNLAELMKRFKSLGIDQQIDYDKFYLYSIITHSTAIEGSTITEIENRLLFDEGIIGEQATSMNAVPTLGKQKSNQKSNQKILEAIRNNPRVTIKEMQDITGLSESDVKKALKRLREEGKVCRMGADNGGYWKEVDN